LAAASSQHRPDWRQRKCINIGEGSEDFGIKVGEPLQHTIDMMFIKVTSELVEGFERDAPAKPMDDFRVPHAAHAAQFGDAALAKDIGADPSARAWGLTCLGSGLISSVRHRSLLLFWLWAARGRWAVRPPALVLL
jgi:hypothetical protein